MDPPGRSIFQPPMPADSREGNHQESAPEDVHEDIIISGRVEKVVMPPENKQQQDYEGASCNDGFFLPKHLHPFFEGPTSSAEEE